jgi:hypothetical protein
VSSTDLPLVIHVFLFVAWLGIDVGVFYSSFVIRRPGLSSDARIELRRVMRGLDLAPRLSLVLMIPAGVGLARLTGLGAVGLPASAIWLVTAIVIAWAVAIVMSFRALDQLGRRRSGHPVLPGFARIDLVLRLAAVAFFVTTGAWSVVAGGIWTAQHVAWKALLFGLVVAAGLWIRVSARDFTPALREVVLAGETPELLARMDAAMHRTYPAVLTVWVGVAAIAVIGITGSRWL